MIAILGRGKSLKQYAKYSYLFDKIYICGRFHKEIKKIGKFHFQNKKIIHVSARTSDPLRNNYYKKLNVEYVQTFCHSLDQFCTSYGKSHIDKYPKFVKIKTLPKCMDKRGYPPLDFRILEKFSRKFDDYKKLCQFLENKMNDKIKKNVKKVRRTRYWPTVGIFAVDLSLNENELKEIYLFGIDIYSTLSYVQYNTQEYLSTENKNPLAKLATYHLYQIAKEFPNIKFYSVSKAKKFNFDLTNWNLI